MKSLRGEVFAFAFFLFYGLASGEIVDIADGRINGTEMTSRLGRNFLAFLGIPYAKPPINALRFEPPEPVEAWSGVLDGATFGAQCVQPAPHPSYNMDEDCLFLNVYTHNLTDSKPVIFFIHGGSFITGTGNNHGPENLMDRDVVVVTINYRLGPLGFLSTGTKEAPGNAGFKDQVMAMKWVQKNIAQFGGDPGKVTISGLSAGSVAVTSHMASPMTKDLFHGVIAISGAITERLPIKTDYMGYSLKLANALKCPTANIGDMITCFKNAS